MIHIVEEIKLLLLLGNRLKQCLRFVNYFAYVRNALIENNYLMNKMVRRL
jgi:hypothetical protein